MFNIIEQRIKLNMKTETRKERTPNTPMVADCLRKALLLLCSAWHRFLLLPRVAHKVCMVAGRCGDGWWSGGRHGGDWWSVWKLAARGFVKVNGAVM